MAPARKASASRLKNEIASLQAKLRKAEASEGERIGALAVKAGLHEIETSDHELTKAFKEIAARFRTAPKLSDETA